MDLVPSLLTSWVAWRNEFSQPDGPPFGILKEKLGLETPPTQVDLERRFGGSCPYHKDHPVVVHPKYGLIYCLCYVLHWQSEIIFKYEKLRSFAEPAFLKDMVITPKDVGARREFKEMLDQTAKFINEPDQWLLYTGLYGSGKTHIMRAINAALSPIAIYVTAGDLETLVHQYRKDDNLAELYDLLLFAPVLLVDDLGMEYGGKLVQSALDKIAVGRYERWPDYPLVMASNMTTNEIYDYVPRVADRLKDVQKATVFRIHAPSYRQVPK